MVAGRVVPLLGPGIRLAPAADSALLPRRSCRLLGGWQGFPQIARSGHLDQNAEMATKKQNRGRLAANAQVPIRGVPLLRQRAIGVMWARGAAGEQPLRVNMAAVAGADITVVVVAVAGAAHPVQAVVAVSAGCAFLAVLRQGPEARLADWFTMGLLLAGNLVVFGVGNFDRLGVLLGAFAVASGVLLIATVLGAYLRQRDRSGSGR